MADEKETARLLKEAVMIVDKLGTFDSDDIDEQEFEDLKELIDKANKLKKNRLWRL